MIQTLRTESCSLFLWLLHHTYTLFPCVISAVFCSQLYATLKTSSKCRAAKKRNSATKIPTEILTACQKSEFTHCTSYRWETLRCLNLLTAAAVLHNITFQKKLCVQNVSQNFILWKLYCQNKSRFVLPSLFCLYSKLLILTLNSARLSQYLQRHLFFLPLPLLTPFFTLLLRISSIWSLWSFQQGVICKTRGAGDWFH